MNEEHLYPVISEDNRKSENTLKDQLFLLGITPKSREDEEELFKILNVHLNYPDDKLANEHRMANKLGQLDLDKKDRSSDYKEPGMKQHNAVTDTRLFRLQAQTCHCCGFFLQQKDITTCQSAPKEVKHLGIANRIFFQTFCYISILLIVMIVVYSAFAFATNISVAHSTNYLSSNLDLLSISLGAKSQITIQGQNSDGQKYFTISSWLGMVMIIIWMFVFGFIKKEIVVIEKNQSKRLGISDFSIVIENMPTGLSREEVEAQFNAYLQSKLDQDFDHEIPFDHIQVVNYNEGKPFYLDEKQFADSQLDNILQTHEKLKKSIAQYIIEYRKYGSFTTPRSQRTYNYQKFHENKIHKIKKYEAICANIRKKLQEKSESTRTVVFVTFLTLQMRNFVIDRNQNTLYYKLKRLVQFWKETDYFKVTKGSNTYEDIHIEEPSEPEDINWGNLGLTNCQKGVRLFFTIFASLIMVGVSLVVVYALSTVQKNNENQRFISILISLAISLTNLLIVKVIQFMTLFQKGYSMNNYQISIAFKSIIVQLINSIAVPILVNNQFKNGNIFGRSGLVEDIFILGIASSFVPPVIRLVDPYNIFLNLRFKYYSDQERRLALDQYELNEISEKMEFQIGLEYIYVIHNFVFICFFVSLQPIIPVFALLGLIMMYWIERYSLYARCQRPVPGPDVITAKLYQLIFLGAIAFALGNLTWSWFLPQPGFTGARIPNWISLGLAVLMFIFPYETLVKNHKKNKNEHIKNYHEQRIFFPSQYDRLNPSTAKKAIEEYRAFIEKKKIQLQGGDPNISLEIFKGLGNLPQNNIYKKNFYRFNRNASDEVIQQLFNNESKNVVIPRELASAFFGQNIFAGGSGIPQPISTPILRGPRNSNSLNFHQSKQQLDPYANILNPYPQIEPPNSADTLNKLGVDLTLHNVYSSNLHFGHRH